MDEKVFELLEKLYGELLDFKQEVNGRFDKIEQRLTKLEIGQERLEDKATEAFEAIDHLVEVNERQHQEIMKELREDIHVIDFAVKRIGK